MDDQKEAQLNEAVFLLKLDLAVQLGETFLLVNDEIDLEILQLMAESRTAMILRLYEFVSRYEDKKLSIEELAEWANIELSRLALETQDDSSEVQLDDLWKDALNDEKKL